MTAFATTFEFGFPNSIECSEQASVATKISVTPTSGHLCGSIVANKPPLVQSSSTRYNMLLGDRMTSKIGRMCAFVLSIVGNVAVGRACRRGTVEPFR